MERLGWDGPSVSSEPKAHEVEPTVGGPELSLGGLDLEPEPGSEICRHVPQRAVRLCLVFGEHHEIVGVANVGECLCLECRVESVEVQIREDRRSRRSL